MTEDITREKYNNSSNKDEKINSILDVVTLLHDLNAKVDAIQRTQAAMKPDIIEHIFRILKQRWSDEAARRRERCW